MSPPELRFKSKDISNSFAKRISDDTENETGLFEESLLGAQVDVLDDEQIFKERDLWQIDEEQDESEEEEEEKKYTL